MQTRSQQTAAAVYKRVVARKEQWKEGAPECKEYGSLAHRLPLLVRRAGLAQAVAFVKTRDKVPAAALLDDLAAVVGMADGENLDTQCRKEDFDVMQYIRLTRKVLAALDWFKRDAETVLKVKASQATNETGGES